MSHLLILFVCVCVFVHSISWREKRIGYHGRMKVAQLSLKKGSFVVSYRLANQAILTPSPPRTYICVLQDVTPTSKNYWSKSGHSWSIELSYSCCWERFGSNLLCGCWLLPVGEWMWLVGRGFSKSLCYPELLSASAYTSLCQHVNKLCRT